MTAVKFCGLTRPQDIEIANRLMPQLIGFVFAPKSKRYIEPHRAQRLKSLLHSDIRTVGVFVNAPCGEIADLAERGIIDIIQLHGNEDARCIAALRTVTKCPILQAFSVTTTEDVKRAERSSADMILLDAPGGGTGTPFAWDLIHCMKRPYFLAGGLHPRNVSDALRTLRPYGVDVSSGIEENGVKSKDKMAEFLAAVRKEDEICQKGVSASTEGSIFPKL